MLVLGYGGRVLMLMKICKRLDDHLRSSHGPPIFYLSWGALGDNYPETIYRMWPVLSTQSLVSLSDEAQGSNGGVRR